MPVSDTQRELHKQHSEALSKLSYFILAATGTGIGFVVQKLDNQRLDGPGLILMTGTVLWLASFLLGLIALQQDVHFRRHNVSSQQLQDKSHPLQPPEGEIPIFMKMTNGWADAANASARWYTTAQHWTLGLGAVAVVGWRFWEMLRLTMRCG